jgi:hypothetical protein
VDDERYVGTVRGIISDKRKATDYVESMVQPFNDARKEGYGLSLTAYAVYFEKVRRLTTPTGKANWHPTQVSNLMNADGILIPKREREIANFESKVAYFKSAKYVKSVLHKGGRKITDQEWDDFRVEYISFLDENINRSKALVAGIRGQ